jgi:hypothetical protein
MIEDKVVKCQSCYRHELDGCNYSDLKKYAEYVRLKDQKATSASRITQR